MANEDKQARIIKRVKAKCDELLNDEVLKDNGVFYLYDLLIEYADKAEKPTIEYLSQNPQIVKQLKKMFSHSYVYDYYDQNSLRKIADSGKLDKFFDAKQLMQKAENRSMEDELSDDWLTVDRLNKLIEQNISEVLNVLHPKTSEENKILQNVTSVMRNDLKSVYKYKGKIEKLQSVLDAEEIIMEAAVKYEDTTSYSSPRLDYKRYQEKKNDIKRILESKDLDLQLMEFCLALNTPATIALLRNNEKIRKNAEKLFDDCKNYIPQRNLVETLESYNINTFRGFLEQNAEKLKKMSGLEVFEAMNMSSSPKNNDLKMLSDVMNLYYRQTYDLSLRSPESYLYYCNIGQSGYWNSYKLGLLDHVGKYAKTPVLEEILEEKLGRTYAHYSYHENALFNSVRKEGVEEFEKRLYAEIKKDINSPTAKFYLKYARDVFALREYTGKYYELAAYLMENHFEKQPELCKSFIGDISKLRGDFSEFEQKKKIAEDMIKTFEENPNSDKSKFYLENVAKMFVSQRADNKTYTTDYERTLAMLLSRLHNTQPQLCNKLCQEAANIIQPETAVDLYCIYPSKELVPAIEKYADKIISSKPEAINDLTVVDLYEKAVKTKLPVLDKAVDCMLKVKDIRFKNEKKEGIDYGDLIAKIKKAKIEEINIYDEAEWMINAGIFKDNKSLKSIIVNNAELDCNELSGCSKLESLCVYRGKLSKSLELLKLPELKGINGKIADKDEQPLIEALLTEKPKKLTTIDLSKENGDILGTSMQRIALMEKYPNLVLKIDYSNKDETALKSINETVRDCKNYKEAAEKRVLAEYLQTMTEKPKSDEFMKFPITLNNGNHVYKDLFAMLEDAKKEKYPDVLLKIAENCGFADIKTEADLLKKVQDKTLLSHLKDFDKKDAFSMLTKPLKSFGWRKTLIDYLEQNTPNKEEFNDMVSQIFIKLGFKAEDVEKLDNKNLSETVYRLQEHQTREQGRKLTQAAFAEWKKNQGIKK